MPIIGVALLMDASLIHKSSESRRTQPFDREARRCRALAGEDLVRRCRTGLLKDHGYVADLLALTGLLAGDNPLFAAA